MPENGRNGNGKNGIKLLPPPTSPLKKQQAFNIQLLVRGVLALLLFIIGFNFSNSAFFNAYPLFGLNYLAQTLIALLAAALGFFILPEAILRAKEWIEWLIVDTVYTIVSDFWELQAKKIQDQRRIKQKNKANVEKIQNEFKFKGAIVIDTSVLIDGRIADIVKLGFMTSPLIILAEVINELHAMSDSSDRLKRQKGRRGLDVIKDLKKKTQVTTIDLIQKDQKGADRALVAYAKEHNLRFATSDFNLNKVADALGVKVLNINELANSLKTVLLPGEEIKIKIIQEGKEKKQGIGFLQDGTMIVVENAKDRVGQEVGAKVSKVIQSPAGKMIFCELLV